MTNKYVFGVLIFLTLLVVGRTGLQLFSATAGEQAAADAIAIVPEAAASQAQAQPLPPTFPSPEESAVSKQEREELLKLRALKAERQAKQEELARLEKMAKDAEVRAAEKIAALEALEARIQSALDQEASANNKKIKKLVAVYEGMKAEKAAPIIAKIDMETIVRMFSRMNEKQVGKILSYMPPAMAVKITENLSRNISS